MTNKKVFYFIFLLINEVEVEIQLIVHGIKSCLLISCKMCCWHWWQNSLLNDAIVLVKITSYLTAIK